MGFSLKAALAGAIKGGAQAVGEIADTQIKEQANQRAQAEAFARQRESDIFRDELAANRERRVDDIKTAREEKQLKGKADALRAGLTSLRESKIDEGSIKGQQALATKLAEAGYTELADKYFDNAIRLGQIESTNERAREEAKYRHMAIAESRADRAERGTAVEFAKSMGTIDKMAQRIRVEDPSNPDKTIPFAEAGGPLVSLYSQAREAGKSNSEALEAVNRTQTLASVALRANPTADPFTVVRKAADQTMVDVGIMKRADFDNRWNPPAPTAAPSGGAAPPAATAPAAKKKVTPGIFNRTHASVPQMGESSFPGAIGMTYN